MCSSSVHAPATPTPAETFAGIIDGLRRAIAAAAVGSPLSVALVLLWPRLMRLSRRFGRLAARIAAGEPPRPARPRAPAAARVRKPYQRLPRRFGWLLRVPQARAAGTQLAAHAGAAGDGRHSRRSAQRPAAAPALPDAGRQAAARADPAAAPRAPAGRARPPRRRRAQGRRAGRREPDPPGLAPATFLPKSA